MLPISPKENENVFSDDVIAVVGPTYGATLVRDQIFDSVRKYIQSILASTYPSLTCSIYMYGSVPLKTFLADSDIDISVVITDTTGVVQPPLCHHVYLTLVKQLEELAATKSAITSVHSITAEVQVIKLQWDSVPIDITLQQYSACIAYSFLEWVNQIMGKGGIFKRSIILIKAWCLYESHILGSQNANLCSYAIEVMIIYVLNNYYEECFTPLDVLRAFVRVFARFNWVQNILTIFGPIPITVYDQAFSSYNFDVAAIALSERMKIPEFLNKPSIVQPQALTGFLEQNDKWKISSGSAKRNKIVPKLVNIIDPIDWSNNIGKSVSTFNYVRILNSLQAADKRMAMIDTAKGDEKFRMYAGIFKNSLAINLNMFQEAKDPLAKP